MKPSTKMQAKLAFVVPAAGSGSRFESELPKQYHKIDELTVIEHTLSALAPFEHPIVVALSPNDKVFETLEYPQSLVTTVKGGDARADSVLSALMHLKKTSNPDWVLVHDAARPCVFYEDIENLIEACLSQDKGGLLVAPSIDTLKFMDGTEVAATLDRSQIRRALTPQMFKLDELIQAMEHAQDKQLNVTDEASCMEAVGYQPVTVECLSANIKITVPHDLQVAKVLIEEEIKRD